eukprot:8098969-Pyramimonas_sp.AAC.1
MVMGFLTLIGTAIGKKSTGALAQSVQAQVLFPHSFFFCASFSMRPRPRARNAQCEIAAPALREEPLRVSDGNQG